MSIQNQDSNITPSSDAKSKNDLLEKQILDICPRIDTVHDKLKWATTADIMSALEKSGRYLDRKELAMVIHKLVSEFRLIRGIAGKGNAYATTIYSDEQRLEAIEKAKNQIQDTSNAQECAAGGLAETKVVDAKPIAAPDDKDSGKKPARQTKAEKPKLSAFAQAAMANAIAAKPVASPDKKSVAGEEKDVNDTPSPVETKKNRFSFGVNHREEELKDRVRRMGVQSAEVAKARAKEDPTALAANKTESSAAQHEIIAPAFQKDQDYWISSNDEVFLARCVEPLINFKRIARYLPISNHRSGSRVQMLAPIEREDSVSLFVRRSSKTKKDQYLVAPLSFSPNDVSNTKKGTEVTWMTRHGDHEVTLVEWLKSGQTPPKTIDKTTVRCTARPSDKQDSIIVKMKGKDKPAQYYWLEAGSVKFKNNKKTQQVK